MSPAALRAVEDPKDRLVESFLSAVEHDSEYMLEMVHSAGLITYKGALWEIRQEVAQAETSARSLCAMSPDGFSCNNEAPCGFGRCLYATPEHASVRTVPLPKPKGVPKLRPRDGCRRPSYELDEAVLGLATLRKLNPPSPLRRTSRAS